MSMVLLFYARVFVPFTACLLSLEVSQAYLVQSFCSVPYCVPRYKLHGRVTKEMDTTAPNRTRVKTAAHSGPSVSGGAPIEGSPVP